MWGNWYHAIVKMVEWRLARNAFEIWCADKTLLRNIIDIYI